MDSGQAPDNLMQQLEAVPRKGVQLCNCAVCALCSVLHLQLQFSLVELIVELCDLELEC